MDSMWSQVIQGAEMMDLTRALRFRDEYAAQYIRALDFPEDGEILEVGCGPGALCRALSAWYPAARVTGVDRDRGFIEYARARDASVRFILGDATRLPFDEGSFDATISHTVQEHVETTAFFSEQYRVLRPGGVCAVLSSRTGMNIRSEVDEQLTEEELRIYKKLDELYNALYGEHGIARYAISERQLMRAMEAAGFRKNKARFLAIANAPDNEDDPEVAKGIIEAGRLNRLDAIERALNQYPDALTEREVGVLMTGIEGRYRRRLRLYEEGKTQWDLGVSVLMIARGVK